MAATPAKPWLSRLATLPFIAAVYAYRMTLGPLLGGNCRFHPTCSQYALDVYREHGAIRGSLLTARRLLRCHPFGGGGYDPVPPPQPPRGSKPTPENLPEH